MSTRPSGNGKDTKAQKKVGRSLVIGIGMPNSNTTIRFILVAALAAILLKLAWSKIALPRDDGKILLSAMTYVISVAAAYLWFAIAVIRKRCMATIWWREKGSTLIAPMPAYFVGVALKWKIVEQSWSDRQHVMAEGKPRASYLMITGMAKFPDVHLDVGGRSRRVFVLRIADREFEVWARNEDAPMTTTFEIRHELIGRRSLRTGVGSEFLKYYKRFKVAEQCVRCNEPSYFRLRVRKRKHAGEVCPRCIRTDDIRSFKETYTWPPWNLTPQCDMCRDFDKLRREAIMLHRMLAVMLSDKGHLPVPKGYPYTKDIVAGNHERVSHYHESRAMQLTEDREQHRIRREDV